jgi:hypothetical protein
MSNFNQQRTTDHGPRTNLIICPIGDRSVHCGWIAGPVAANFDLFLLYYGDGPDTAVADARHYVRRKGFKFEHLHYAATEYADVLRQYQRIWCPDDDIACDTASINLLFDIFARYQLQLAQPAIAKGDLSFKGLAQRPGNILRYTPYVEVMCPIFTREAFFKVSDTFLDNRSGWGLDWVWPKRFSIDQMAIIDKVGIHHTGPLGKGEHYKNLAKLGIDPYRDFQQTVARHGGIDWTIHRRMLRGRVRMKRVKDPEDRRSLTQKIADQIRWLRLKRSAA